MFSFLVAVGQWTVFLCVDNFTPNNFRLGPNPLDLASLRYKNLTCVDVCVGVVWLFSCMKLNSASHMINSTNSCACIIFFHFGLA